MVHFLLEILDNICYNVQRSGLVAQLVRAPPCHGGGHGFESRLGRSVVNDYNIYNYHSLQVTRGILAQLGEHLPYKQRVTGSSPVGPIYPKGYADVAQLAEQLICNQLALIY